MSKKELGGYLGVCEKNKERKNIEFEAVRGEEWQKKPGEDKHWVQRL